MILENYILVWIRAIDDELQHIDRYKTYLNKEEILRASRFYFDHLTNDYIVCRGFAKWTISNLLNTSPQEVVFSKRENGKPYLANHEDLQFNISHAGRKVALVITLKNIIGVDIEYHDRSVDYIKLAKHFFSKTEYHEILNVKKEDLSASFFRCWTRKEAFIKALGDGLNFPLDLFAVNFAADKTPELLHTFWDEDEKERWQLFNIPFPKGENEDYSGAVAVRSKNKRLKFL